VTNRPYSGCNVVLLWMAQAAGYRTSRYLLAGRPKLFPLLLGLVEEYPGDYALLDERPEIRNRCSDPNGSFIGSAFGAAPTSFTWGRSPGFAPRGMFTIFTTPA
jgi:hypothetical protein